MTTTTDLLTSLRQSGARFSIDGDEVRITNLPMPQPEEVVRMLTERKSEIVGILVAEQEARSAARANLERIHRGGAHLFEMEQRGDTGKNYEKWSDEWIILLQRYIEDYQAGLLT